MSFSNSKPAVGQLLPLTGANLSSKKVSTNVLMVRNTGVSSTTSQLNAKDDKLQIKRSLTAVSRRQMVSLAGICLGSISLLLAAPAEARMSKGEMKNKLLEKLRELREKFGLPKAGDESREETSSPQKDAEVEDTKPTPQLENRIEDRTYTPQLENQSGEKKSTPQQGSEIGNTSTPKLENEGGENPTLQLEKESEQNSTRQLGNGSGEVSTPQEEDQSGEKFTPQAKDEGGDKSDDGEMSTPPKKDESPILPFLNLTEIEGEPLVEATLGR